MPADAGTQALDRFALVLEAVTGPEPVPLHDLDPSAAHSVSDLLEVLSPYPEVEVTLTVKGQQRELRLRPAEIATALRHDDPAAEASEPYGVLRTAAGVLYALNLHTGRFQIEDDLGGSIDLSVPPSFRPGALRLVDQRVVATGVAQQTTGGKLRLGDITGIESEEELPGIDTNAFRRPVDLDSLLGTAAPLASLDELVIEGLSDEEAEAFTTALG